MTDPLLSDPLLSDPLLSDHPMSDVPVADRPAPPTVPPTSRGRQAHPRLRWLITFVGFPAGGVAADVLVGPIDTPAAAALGGLATGAVLGAVQSFGLALRGRSRLEWIGATAAGLTVGLGVGATAVDFRTSTAALVLQGAICGLAVGLAQAVVLGRAGRVGGIGHRRRALAWAPLLATLWALGWAVTASIGVDVDRRWSVFGSSGALFVTVATALALPWFTSPSNAGSSDAGSSNAGSSAAGSSNVSARSAS